jgi:ATP-binding cassette subfamily B protein
VSAPQRLLLYLRRARGRYAFGGLLTLAYACAFQLIPLSIRNFVQQLDGSVIEPQVIRAAVYLVGSALILASLRLFSRIVLFRAGRQVEYELRNDFFAHLQRLPQSYFASHRTGDLMSRAVNDINSVRLLLGMGLMNVIQTPVLYFGAIGVMFALDPVLTFFVVLPYPLFIGIGRIFGGRLHRANLASQEQLAELSTVAQENAAGVLVVRAYGMDERERSRFEVENEELYGRQMRLAGIQASMFPIVGLLPALAMILVIFVGGARVQDGRMIQADLWAFATYIFQLTFPTFIMGWVIALVQRGLVALERLGEILDTLPTIRDRDDVLPVEHLRGAVETKGLRIAYPGRQETPALLDVNLSVRTGQTVGIVGQVGTGKTTLVNVIPRVLEVPDGTVFIDGVDVNRIPIRTLRSNIAMVPQESFLFSTTIEENIGLGIPDAGTEEIHEAARRAHIQSEIEDLPLGFDTPVGERGITLSGGQRQRIALARALLLKPAILILDDALSSVDAMTEEAILKEIRGARAGRTCFIVAHRLSAVRDADHILVLDEGRVVEQGTHGALLEQKGLYAKIFERQRLEAEIEAEV